MARILILGGSGFVGRYIVARLVARGDLVVVPARRRERARHLLMLPTVDVVQADIFGGTMDPHQAWLVLRGVRTLGLRVERGQENAMKLAQFLERHPKVVWMNYPGLPGHPQHALACEQMDGFGSMIAFGVRGGLEGGRIVIDNVRLVTLAVSLGGVESLIEHPASMTHASVPKEDRDKAGILDELVRMSVGCEDFEDLRDDLSRALDAIPGHLS